MAAVDFGYTLLAALGLFGYLGWRLDARYETMPLFLTGGIFLGLAVAFSSLFRRLNLIEAKRKAAKERERNAADPKE